MSEFRYEYFLTEGEYIIDGNSHLGYGIRLVDKSNLTSDGVTYNDISTNKERVGRLVFLCNELKLYPVHLKDVIEDFLFEV